MSSKYTYVSSYACPRASMEQNATSCSHEYSVNIAHYGSITTEYQCSNSFIIPTPRTSPTMSSSSSSASPKWHIPHAGNGPIHVPTNSSSFSSLKSHRNHTTRIHQNLPRAITGQTPVKGNNASCNMCAGRITYWTLGQDCVITVRITIGILISTD